MKIESILEFLAKCTTEPPLLCKLHKYFPPLPRADGKGGFFNIKGGLADSGQPVIGNIVANGMGK